MKILKPKPLNFKINETKIGFKKKRTKWSKQDDILLIHLIISYGKDWNVISKKIKKYSPKQCMYHWDLSANPSIKKGEWNQKEELLLLKIKMLNNNESWSNLSKHIPSKFLLL